MKIIEHLEQDGDLIKVMNQQVKLFCFIYQLYLKI